VTPLAQQIYNASGRNGSVTSLFSYSDCVKKQVRFHFVAVIWHIELPATTATHPLPCAFNFVSLFSFLSKNSIRCTHVETHNQQETNLLGTETNISQRQKIPVI